MDNSHILKISSKFLLFLILITPSISYCQLLENDLQYTEDEYSQVDEISSNLALESMLYDASGWLWVSGQQLEANNFKLGSTVPVISRFNGKSFKSIDLPINAFNKNAKVRLIKKDKNHFYVKFFQDDLIAIYELNVNLLEFKEVTLPNSISNNFVNNGLLASHASFKYIEQSENHARIYQINSNNEFIFLNEINLIKNINELKYISLPNGFILSNDIIGIHYYDHSGNFIKKLEDLDFNGLEILPEENLFFDSVFYNNNVVYGRLRHDNSYFMYDEKTETWNKIVINGLINDSSSTKYSKEYLDAKGNIIIEKVFEGRTELYAYTSLESKPLWTRTHNFEMANNPIITSRDFSRSFVLKTNDRILQFNLGANSIKAFLNEYSIRSFLQLNADEVLVATDFSGWFKLDLKDGSVMPKKFYINGNRIPHPSQNRSFFYHDEYIWSNDNHGLLEVNSNSFEVKRHLDSLVITSMNQDEKRIVLADVSNNVYEFNKKTKLVKALVTSDSLNYQNFVFKKSTIYAATNGGLVSISEEIKTLYQPSIIEDQPMIAIHYDKNLGLLLGTQSGKILNFDEKHKAFTTLYEDELGASIASFVRKGEFIWINTFAGVVAFNYRTKETFRFGVNDGLSHYECNRYSTLLLDSGNLLVGTLRGVNYLDLDEIIQEKQKNEIAVELKFLAMTYFDASKNEVVTNYDLTEINSFDNISLSPVYNTMNIELGVIKAENVKSYNLRYKLNDNKWTHIENNFDLNFTNLAAGDYKIEIQAIDKIKGTLLGSKSLNFEVPVIFYKTLWFSLFVLVSVVGALLIYIRSWKQSRDSLLKNKLLRTEIEYKKKDLADFASNISRNQQWNDYLIAKMEEIKEAKGRKKGAALISLEKEIKEKNSILENNFEFQKRIDVLSNKFYNSLIKRYPNLSKTEVKLCSLIRLDLDNHDIATLQNVDITSVYTSRYRLRKKLNITSDTDLNIFLKSF
ncbi:hypothetical protein A9Q86_16065 [Flavobacteriales bacterium 33_180_T64]|nr:hypothetical protein A9Q86_16065 [Flavobacteriales bacterium 33_180_T64]